MECNQTPTLVFGQFRLDPRTRRLFRADVAIRLGSRPMALLLALTERPGEVLSRGELEARVWPRTLVEDSSLRVHIAALRKALGDDSCIANVPGRGYSFVGELQRLPALAQAPD